MKNQHGDVVKLSVFVGSAFRDLKGERSAIIDAILRAGHIPEGMELWAPDFRPTQQMISDKLAMCDVHLVVLGARYGTRIKPGGVSFTEWEFDQSIEAGRPILRFLLDDAALKEEWEKNPPEGDERNAYENFRAKLKENAFCNHFGAAGSSVATAVVAGLNQAIDILSQSQRLPGWVRAGSEAAKLANELQGNDFLTRVVERVVGFQTTGDRFQKERMAKKAAAGLFWDAMMNRLARNKRKNIFLESGSSMAYVSEAFEARADREQEWSITTNNALALLQLLLFTDGDVRRNPPVAPDPNDPYGAIFTKACLGAYERPPVRPRALVKKEKDAIDQVVVLLKSASRTQVILATASGWDTKHRFKAFQGPHVGSHANMLFKRALFMTEHPVVLFLSRRKVDPRFPEANFKSLGYSEESGTPVRYCYPVFGRELPLTTALEETPLALCIGYEREQGEAGKDLRSIADELKSGLIQQLAELDFEIEDEAKPSERDNAVAGAIMIANREFRRIFRK